MHPVIGLVVALLVRTAAGDQTPLGNEEFAIGFDLTPSYGTAAIVSSNGIGKPLAFVNGSGLYKKVMNQLSHSLFWPPRQYRTYPRPDPPNATAVAILAEMLDALRSEVEAEIGGSVPSAAVTVPHLSQLYDTTLQAACDAIHLQCIQLFQHEDFRESLTRHENALIAGHGLGLCQPYTVTNHNCSLTQRLPSERHYLIGYYADGVEAVLTSNVSSAYAVDSFAYADFSLGSSMRDKNPREEFYWEEVRRLISLPLVGTIAQKPNQGHPARRQKRRSKVPASVARNLAAIVRSRRTARMD